MASSTLPKRAFSLGDAISVTVALIACSPHICRLVARMALWGGGGTEDASALWSHPLFRRDVEALESRFSALVRRLTVT
jgi:hypothetical protein